MSTFLEWFTARWSDLWNLLKFEVAPGIYFSNIILVLLIIGLVINVFWKGAKT